MYGVGLVDRQKAETMALPAPRLVRAAREFEAQMLKELMKPMALSEEGDDESKSGGALGDFATEALGQALSRAGGFGIADRIISSVSRIETSGHTIP